MKKITIIIFSILLSTYSFSQGTITGTIQSNKTPVEFCSVILMQAKDSSIVKAAFTNMKGEYLIEKIDSGIYFVKAQLIGFEEYYT